MIVGQEVEIRKQQTRKVSLKEEQEQGHKKQYQNPDWTETLRCPGSSVTLWTHNNSALEAVIHIQCGDLSLNPMARDLHSLSLLAR